MSEPFNQESETSYLVFEPQRLWAALLAFVRRHAAELLCAVLLVLMSLQMLGVVARKSITIDEIVMIPSAYYHLAAGNFQLVNEHPPLSKIAAGVPLLFVQPEEARPHQLTAPPYTPDARLAYESSFWENNIDRFDTLGFWAGAGMIGLTVALGILIFRFARELFGARTAVLAVALFALEPTVLAHGRLVPT